MKDAEFKIEMIDGTITYARHDDGKCIDVTTGKEIPSRQIKQWWEVVSVGEKKEPSTFDWKTAMKLFADGVEIEEYHHERWFPSIGENGVFFMFDKRYRRAPVKVEEDNELIRHLTITNLKEQVARLTKENEELKEEIDLIDKHGADSEDEAQKEIARLSDQLSKAREMIVTCRNELERVNTVKDGMPSVSHNLMYNITQCLTSLDSQKSGEKTLNSKEELSSSLHDAPSPLKQEDSEPSAEECLEWFGNQRYTQLTNYDDGWFIELTQDEFSGPFKSPLEAIRSAMKSETSK